MPLGLIIGSSVNPASPPAHNPENAREHRTKPPPQAGGAPGYGRRLCRIRGERGGVPDIYAAGLAGRPWLHGDCGIGCEPSSLTRETGLLAVYAPGASSGSLSCRLAFAGS